MLRSALPCVLLLVLLALVLPTSPSFAEDEGLVEQVRSLRAEVQALTQRVAVLEQKEAGRVGMVGIVGAYELDRASLEEALVAVALDTSGPILNAIEDPDERAKARANIEETARKRAQAMRMTLTLSPDGTFNVRSDGADAKGTARGTWGREGTTIVMTTTHEDDKPLDPHDVLRAELDGGTLRLKPEPELDLVLILRKR